MDLSEYGVLLRFLIMPWLFLLFLIVIFRVGRSGVRFRDLVSSTQDGPAHPDRIATLTATVFVAISYIVIVMNEQAIVLGSGDNSRYLMPDIPAEMLLILGGTQGTYVGKKIFDRFREG
ncbi:hypothetical protein [Roseibium sp.]|uniref:hypothetical protein n=1 Tax=Roseibium sp. TaxID=1936156 RepID=UPI003D09D846